MPSAVQEVVGGLCCKGSSLARGQLGVHQDPEGLFCQAASQQVGPSLFWCLGLFIPWGRTLCYPFSELCEAYTLH